MVKELSSLDQYRRDFNERLGNMICERKITTAQADLCFYTGLPKTLQKEIKPVISATVQGGISKTNPPTRADTIRIVWEYYNEDDIDRDNASSDSEDDPFGSDSSNGYSSNNDVDSDTDSETEKQKTRRKKRKEKRKEKEKSGKEVSEDRAMVEKLAEDFQKLQSTLNTLTQQQQFGLPGPTAMIAAVGYGAPQGPRRCYMCDGVEGFGLKHQLGLRFCPETDKLVTEGLLIFKGGRLAKTDGSKLPRVSAGMRGIASLLHMERWANQQASSKGKEREVPPHMVASSSRTCNNMGLFQDDQEVIQGNVYALSMEELTTFPVQTRKQVLEDKGKQRQGKEEGVKKVRFEFRHRTEEQTGPRNKEGDGPHPANTQEGWKEQKKEDRQRRQDEGAGKGRSGRSNVQFTSDVQNSVDLDGIQETILNMKVTLPLREILGMSSGLQKRFAGLTRTRREVRTAAAAIEEVHECEGVLIDDDTGGYLAEVLYDEENENLVKTMERYAAAVGLEQQKFYAMVTGIIEGKFGGKHVKLLIDSGSELNLIMRRVYEQTNETLDEDGKR